jgi:proteasome lid subunit RPN8/RPN11
MKQINGPDLNMPPAAGSPDAEAEPLESLPKGDLAAAEAYTQTDGSQSESQADTTIIEVKASGVVITIQPDAQEPEIVVNTPDRPTVIVVRVRKYRVGDSRTVSAIPAPHVRISEIAFTKVRDTLGRLPAERGGIFVGPDPFCIEDFIFDEGNNAKRTAVYYPDTVYLNEILERDHEPLGRRFVGLVHSHPDGLWRPSGHAGWGDVKAARNNLMGKGNMDLPALFIPIVESAATTGNFVLHPYIMIRSDFRVLPARYEVID